MLDGRTNKSVLGRQAGGLRMIDAQTTSVQSDMYNPLGFHTLGMHTPYHHTPVSGTVGPTYGIYSDSIDQMSPRRAVQALASPPKPLDYPFNSSATIHAALSAHLDTHHPQTMRLVSPRLYRLLTHLALKFALYLGQSQLGGARN